MSQVEVVNDDAEYNQRIIETGMQAPEKIDAEYLFDYDRLWLEFEAQLYGGKLKQDKDGNYVIIKSKDSNPFMNEKGIKDFMSFVRASVNKIGGSSIYGSVEQPGVGEQRVLAYCRRFNVDVASFLFENAEDYELEISKYQPLITVTVKAFEDNMRKSLNGRALELALQGKRVLETHQFNDEKKGPGIVQRYLHI